MKKPEWRVKGDRMIQNMRDFWLRIGLIQRVVLLTIVIAAVGAAVLLTGWARKPSMALLYSGLESEQASHIVEKIRDSGTAYELRSGGTAVYVPEERVYSLRLELAGQGLPGGDQRGYRILDEEKIGTSPFTQRLNYRRALEGEIAKSVQILENVVSARVHIVRPESTLFAGQEKSSSATVILKLKPGWRLSPGNVAAIVHMVSGSVENLKPDAVVVVDSAGNLLSGTYQDGVARGMGNFLDFKTQHEEYLSHKVEDMLAQVLGPGRATVRVSCTIDNTNATSTVETYEPSAKVTTKEETKSKSSTGGAPAEGAAAGSTKDETNTTEYAVGRTVKQEVLAPGKITSTSVAAMVDLSPPPPPAATASGSAATPPAPTVKVADVELIIRSALGLKETDSIKVVDTPFSHATAADAPSADEEATTDKRAFYLDIARNASLGVLVLGALVALKIVTGGSKKRSNLMPVAGLPAGAAGAALAGGGTLALPPGAESDPALLRSRITAALQENPEEVKRLFLAWVEGEKGEV
jgi:flagellar M-ring protein FliF